MSGAKGKQMSKLCQLNSCFHNRNIIIYKRLFSKMVSDDSSRSNSQVKRNKKQKKSRREKDKDKDREKEREREKDNKDRGEKNKKERSRSRSRSDEKDSLESEDKYEDRDKRKKNQQKDKDRRKKSKSRERSRQKKKYRDRSKSLEKKRDAKRKERQNQDRDKDKEREKIKQRQRERNQEKEKQKEREQQKEKEKAQKQATAIKEKQVQPTKNTNYQYNANEEQRAKKFAMRQVRARLLKLNGLYGGDDSDQSEENMPMRKPVHHSKIEAAPPIIPKKVALKKQSKWGKNSSNQPSIIPSTDHQAEQLTKKPENSISIDQNHSLDIEPSVDVLKISEDKSIQIQNEADKANQMQEEIDPLDQYMNEIEGQAAAQMELPKKGDRRNVISFEEIITKPQTEMIDESKEDEEQFKKQFLEAIKNIDEVKANQDKKGTMMENNEDKSDGSDFQEEPEEELDFFAKQRKMAERKELGQVDHSKIQYEEVTFNLYRQADEVRTMDPKEVVRFRKQAGDIKIRGKNILNPVFNWYQCGFSEHVLSVIEKNNYAKPFPIQAQSIPMILSGRDVIGIAETGSGKTFAYLLPLIKHISAQRPVGEGEGPIGIIMTPTRQLANQVYLQAKRFCKQSRIRVLAVYGGLTVQKQLSDFRKGAEIVICTPGRMIDILTLNKGRITNLKRVTMLVIDEADRMFDLGFEPQITRILDNIRPERQTVMFSATFPKNVENLARRILTNPVQILVGSRGQACRNVEQIVEVREQPTKFLRLLEILGNWNEKGSILIFIDKQTEADYLYQQLLKFGYDSLVLHGAMDPTDREFAIYDFKKGIKTIMISTSISARGLDIKQIVLVVNFKCPNHLEDYIHRIGRTGRAGNKGTAITFITPQQEQYSIDLIKALEMSEVHPPEDLIKLSQEYLRKVKKGEARKIRNRNIQGIGFKFDKEQEQKTSQIKDMIKKQLKTEGLGGFDDSDDDDIETKKKKQEELRGRNQQERVVEAIKNPQTKNKLLNQAVKAVSEAIKNGSAMTTEKLLEIAVNSMKQSVTKHKVITTVDDGVEQVTKLITEFQNKGGHGDGIDFFSYDFEINDYPIVARQRACSQQFLHQVQRQNNCTISLRGVYVQPGKKAPIGSRKLYLHIQSEDKSYVSTAYKDIKRVIQEGAYENMHMITAGKYTI